MMNRHRISGPRPPSAPGIAWRARGLERAILQRLAAEAADQAALERRVRELMAELDQPEASPGVESFDPLDFELAWVRRGPRHGPSRLTPTH